MSKNFQSLIKNITSIQNDLEMIEKDLYPEYEKMRERCDLFERIDRKLEDLSKIQKISDRLNVNAGGEIFELSKSSIINCRYDNILKKSLDEDFDRKEIFVDISAQLFEVMVDIMTFSEDDLIFNKKEIRFYSIEQGNDKYEQITENLKNFFIGDFNNVRKEIDIKICKP